MKYPRIKYPDETYEALTEEQNAEIVIEEKIDGANFRMWTDENGDVVFGSRNKVLESDPGNRWRRSVEYLNKVSNDINPFYVYFGEAMIEHKIRYDFTTLPPIIMFDIYDVANDRWLNLEEKSTEFKRLGLEQVRVIKVLSAYELTKEEIHAPIKSVYYIGEAEGKVFKNYSNGVFMKYVFEAYREIKKIKDNSTGDLGYFLDKYVSRNTIDKMIFKLMDEGHERDMSMMTILPKRLFEDIIEENWSKILHENKVLDLKSFRKAIAKRCVEVLRGDWSL